MANILNNNFHNLRLEINSEEYWDFFINKDNDVIDYNIASNGELYDKCLASYIDISDKACVEGDDIVSKETYTWEDAKSQPHVLHNVGYTGVDNNLIHFERDRIANREFVEIYQNSTYLIDGSSKLRLHQIKSGTKLYDYPLTVEENKIRLNGGFYQGFFKTNDCKYQVLPSEMKQGDIWHLEFVLNKTEFEKESDKTLNDKYPNNKGIFFYLGTRAENKWDYFYTKDEDNQQLFIDDYLEEDEEIGDGSCRINAFVGEVITMPIEWESEAVDDYLSFKYYDESLYKIQDHGLEDYFYEYHKANIIDENQPSSLITCWCKNSDCNTEEKKTYRISCCCANKCRKIETTVTSSTNSKCDGYLSRCTPFDLIEDFDEIDDIEDYIEGDLDISDFEFTTENGFNLKEVGQRYFETDNKFLLFDRTCNGYTVDTYQNGDKIRYINKKTNFKGNLFVLMNRTCNGYTVDTIDKLRESENIEYDTKKDITRNAFALRITDDGEIGYRYIVQDCEAEDFNIKVIEAYSTQNLIKEGEWYVVNVRIKAFANTMILEFYINGKLVFITNEIPKFNFRKLNDIDEKQMTVPYNISIGGGTQGLCETILPNYMLNPYREYDLETNFAGTFIGFISKFRFYTCNMDFFAVQSNFKYEFRQ